MLNFDEYMESMIPSYKELLSDDVIDELLSLYNNVMIYENRKRENNRGLTREDIASRDTNIMTLDRSGALYEYYKNEFISKVESLKQEVLNDTFISDEKKM